MKTAGSRWVQWITPLLVLLSLSVHAQAVLVWLPDARRVATLTPQGLFLPGGQEVGIRDVPSSRPLGPAPFLLSPGRSLVAEPLRPGVQVGDTPYRLRVVDAAGRTLGTRTLPFYPAIFPAALGPCVASLSFSRPQPTQCFNPDLGAVRATVPGQLLSVSSDGLTAYTTPTSSTADAAPFSLAVPITRHELRSGAQVSLQLPAVRPGVDLQGSGFLDFVRVMHARYFISDWTPVRGGHFLVCLQMTHVESGCQLLIADGDARVRRWVEDGTIPLFPDVSRDGGTALVLMNSLHVWDMVSGKRTLLLREAHWVAGKRQPYAAYFTADSRAIVVVTGAPDPQASGFTALPGTARAEVYRLPDGRRLQTFPVLP